MRIRAVQAAFDWASLDDSPSLGTVRRCLQVLPDAAILRGLRTARGRGRDDDPVTSLWGVAVLTPLLRHPSHEACLAELRRNPALRRLIGIEAEEHVPHHGNPSRFLDALGYPAHLAAIHSGFDPMVRRLGGADPNLRHRLAESVRRTASSMTPIGVR